MARPLSSAKKTVDLSGPKPPPGSRIRRDPPPPPPRVVTPAEVRERETWVVATGIAAVGLALAIVMVAVADYAGWSPSHYTLVIEDKR
jgi:hypothetical protein